jgi:NADPH:quinone reductase-like Zn-dependent oxidoreductase
MRAVRLTTSGDRRSPRLQDEPLPTPGRNEALVRVHAASLNYRDQAILAGHYWGAVKNNGVPLSDGAGEVGAVGADVTRVKVSSITRRAARSPW